MEEKENALLEIRDLSVIYKTDDDTVYAVNHLNLEINAGESLGLVGETGAGKTTTALSILRLIANPPGQITSGEILFEGEDLLKAKKETMHHYRGNLISMIFQDPMTSLDPVYTVGEQIAEVIRLHSDGNKEETRKKAEDMLELVGIPRARYDEYPHQFSGGMKQRVVIAMSLACSPKLLLADEPTTALDVTIQAQVLELMNGLKEKMNTAMLLITHDLGVVAQVCDRVAIMYAGEIVEQGSRDEIFQFPRHPYTIGLFASIPTLEETASRLQSIKGQMPAPTDLPPGCTFHPRCPYATELCASRKPEMVGVSDTHHVRCLAAEGAITSAELEEVIRRGR